MIFIAENCERPGGTSGARKSSVWSNGLGNHALEYKLAGVLADEFAIACLMAVELNAGRVRDQRVQQRLALDKRQARDVTAIKMQKIEGVVDEPHGAPAVARGLSLRKARQSIVPDTAQFAVEIGSFDPQL